MPNTQANVRGRVAFTTALRCPRLLFAAALVTALLIGPATAQSQPFRFLSYNVQGLTPTGRWSYSFSDGQYGIEEEPRARAIARLVVSGGYDVVVFEEVFDEDFRDALIGGLRATYPHRITYIDSRERSAAEDSGLAVFSKFPFLAVAPARGDRPDARCSPRVHGGCPVAFDEFYDCHNSSAFLWHSYGDCDAEKGVAYVRVSNPATGRPLNVFWTHTQSGAGTKDGVVTAAGRARARQVADIAAMVGRYTTPSADEDTVLAGDFNITGGRPETHREYREFMEIFTAPQLGFVDLQHRYGPWQDYGWTTQSPFNSRQESEGRRIDFILLRDGATSLCAYHQTVERRFANDRTSLSDHDGVAVILGPELPKCAPASAAPGSSVTNETLPAGAVHWYLYDAGTYTFDFPDGVPASFYDVEDVSRPLAAEDRVSGLEGQFSVARPRAFLLRVGDPNAPGRSYSVGVRRHDGSSLDQPIQLYPSRREHFTMPAPPSPGGVATRHFRFHTKRLFSGDRQSLMFSAIAPNVNVTLAVYTGNGPDRREVPGTRAAGRGSVWLTGALLPPEAREYYLVVETDGAAAASVAWTTDLVSVAFDKLRCQETDEESCQQDLHDDDTIFMKIKIDDEPWQKVKLGDFDTNQAKWLRAYSSSTLDFREVNFTRRIRIRLWEYDGEFLFADDDLLGDQTIDTQDRDHIRPVHQHVLFEDEGAYYRLWFWINYRQWF